MIRDHVLFQVPKWIQSQLFEIFCTKKMRSKGNLRPRNLRFLHVGKMTEEVTSALY
jgi:hypothetical protein